MICTNRAKEALPFVFIGGVLGEAIAVESALGILLLVHIALPAFIHPCAGPKKNKRG